MKRLLLTFALLSLCFFADAQRSRARRLSMLPEGNLNFIVASDMGREGARNQAQTAGWMGQFADSNRLDFAAIAGDPIHDDGVTSTTDPQWKIRIEDIYTAPSLHAIPWYVISGNHEYHGSVQAVLDYTDVSERWNAPQRYYSITRPIPGGGTALFVFLDTPPLIEKYRNDEEYTDAGEQDIAKELAWLEQTLTASHDTWKFVIGHHPVYAATDKNETERADMRARVEPILEKNDVDFYIGGHIHNFQHIVPTGKTVNYIVNSSASESRTVEPLVPGSVFVNPEPGFSAFSISPESVQFYFVNNEGRKLYSQTVTK